MVQSTMFGFRAQGYIKVQVRRFLKLGSVHRFNHNFCYGIYMSVIWKSLVLDNTHTHFSKQQPTDSSDEDQEMINGQRKRCVTHVLWFVLVQQTEIVSNL